MPRFTLDVDMNVLNHLGIGLYSSTPAVVTEIISNAWDADATKVKITISEDRIIVLDDGHGMTAYELANQFLKVGYARREHGNGARSEQFDRPVMGRKGIGKLAMFSLANKIEIWSKRKSEPSVQGQIDVKKLKEKISRNEKYELEDVDEPYSWASHGTRIRLSNLNTGTDKTESYLRPRVARRFSIIGDSYNFSVILNDKVITTADRGYHHDLQFLWYLDEQTKERELALAKNLATGESGQLCISRLDNTIDHARPSLRLSGFIGTVDKPAKLRAKDANINQISLFANGRVFQEDMLKEIGTSRVFNSYLVGEIHADFLDSDNIDRATANREAVKQSDPLVSDVREWLKRTLSIISDQWDEWRRELSSEVEDTQLNAALESWYGGLDKRDKKLAQRLINPILSTDHANSPKRNNEIRRDLVKSAIVGFEKLRIRRQLDRLDGITDVLSLEFQKIFTDLNDVEATHYHEITQSRLAVIEKFQDLTDQKVLEKVAQKYLFDHLWLLDPTWDRLSGSEVMEQTLTRELKKVNPAAESGARLDIAYRASSGRHVIIELKRPGIKSVDVYALMQQGAKYRGAMKEYLTNRPDLGGLQTRVPPIDVYFVTEHAPNTTDGDAIAKLRNEDMQAFTYSGMIANARRAYSEYLSCESSVTRIEDIVRHID